MTISMDVSRHREAHEGDNAHEDMAMVWFIRHPTHQKQHQKQQAAASARSTVAANLFFAACSAALRPFTTQRQTPAP